MRRPNKVRRADGRVAARSAPENVQIIGCRKATLCQVLPSPVEPGTGEKRLKDDMGRENAVFAHGLMTLGSPALRDLARSLLALPKLCSLHKN